MVRPGRCRSVPSDPRVTANSASPYSRTSASGVRPEVATNAAVSTSFAISQSPLVCAVIHGRIEVQRHVVRISENESTRG